jgi:hypothetical protein
MTRTCFCARLHVDFFWKNMKISSFGGISKVLKLIVFVGQFWALFATFIVAKSMPETRLNL